MAAGIVFLPSASSVSSPPFLLTLFRKNKQKRKQKTAPTEEKAEEEVKPEKTIFNVVLASVNDLTKNKLKVIKAIRAMRPEDSLVQVSEEGRGREKRGEGVKREEKKNQTVTDLFSTVQRICHKNACCFVEGCSQGGCGEICSVSY